jgi:hypothetical protein
MSAVFACAALLHCANSFPGDLVRAVILWHLQQSYSFFVLMGHITWFDVLISLAIMWELPKTGPRGFAAIPSCSACFASSKVRDRMTWFKTGCWLAHAADTSSGIRFDLWKTAVQTIGEHPIEIQALGWSTQFNPAST